MLLTSSQVSVLVSTAIIISFTLALFLAGYVVQQQTLRGLQAEIKPRVARIHAMKTATSAAHAFSAPPPPISHATPTLAASRPQAAGWAGVSAAQGAEVNGIVDSDGSKKREWKSREKLSEATQWSKGQERFEVEGDDFFRAVKAPASGGQVVAQKDGRRGLWGK